MYTGLNITSGRLRHQLNFFVKTGGVDEWGQPKADELVATRRGEVKVLNGRDLMRFGATMNERVLTILMWQDESITEEMTLEWVGRKGRYKVDNISPDETGKGMIVTATIQQHGNLS